MFQPFQTLQVQLHKPNSCSIHSLNFTLFSILFYAFPLFQFQIYNYNSTIPILQLQTTFYKCTNCHQLHVKICPVLRDSVYYFIPTNVFLSNLPTLWHNKRGPYCEESITFFTYSYCMGG